MKEPTEELIQIIKKAIYEHDSKSSVPCNICYLHPKQYLEIQNVLPKRIDGVIYIYDVYLHCTVHMTEGEFQVKYTDKINPIKYGYLIYD